MEEGSDVHLYIVSQLMSLQLNDLLLLLYLLAFVLLFIFSSVFEALFIASKRQILSDVSESKKNRLEKLINIKDKLQLSCNIGIFVVNVYLFSVTVNWLASSLGKFSISIVIFGALITFGINIVISNVLALMLAQRKSVQMLRLLMPFQLYVVYLFYPIIVIIEVFQKVFGRFVSIEEVDDSEVIEDRIIESVRDAKDLTVLSDESEKMIMRVLELKETSASEVMTPRTDMVSISQDALIPEALKLAHEHGHSRIPVYKDTQDVIVGIFYTRDLLPLFAEGVDISEMKITEISRQPVMIPETKNIVMLLQDLKREKLSMVVLVDEYGGTAGLVTLEDVLEEIVGDIRDEYDEDEIEYNIVPVKDAEDLYEADARCRLDQIYEELEVELPEEEDYDTLGGYLSFLFGHVPEEGAKTEDEYFKYEIVKADERKVDKVLLTRKRDEEKDNKSSQRLQTSDPE